MILLATADPKSPLFALRGQKDILTLIFNDAVSSWKTHISYPIDEAYKPQPFVKLGEVRFPKVRLVVFFFRFGALNIRGKVVLF